MVEEKDLSLLIDLYELAMVQAYWSESMDERATFSLFFRKLPPNRNFILACGQQHVAPLIESLRFNIEHLQKLERLDRFQPEFLDWLGRFRFSGDMHALPEGTPVFPQEPLLEIEAPIAEAQLLESLVMNYVHLESVLASKAIRLSRAAGDIPVIDFAMRRMHGTDAAHRGIRAFRMAGFSGTSNVLASLDYDVAVNGTMAHSFIQAHANEMDAFRAYARLYPGTTLLVDTYHVEKAVQQIIHWLQACPDVDIGAIRLDSGDIREQAVNCRAMLDEAGFNNIRILASGGLDEYRIADLVGEGVPIDGFGVGTAAGAASDAPSLELAYKLTEYAGTPRMKNSPGKQSYPGRKQVFRETGPDGVHAGDLIAAREENGPGEPLLVPTIRSGTVIQGSVRPLAEAAEYSREAVDRLPSHVKSLGEAEPYPVQVSERLMKLQASTLKRLQEGSGQ